MKKSLANTSVLLVVAFSFVHPASLAAQATAPAVRIAEEPVIDGSLAEPAWAELPLLSDFIQRTPRDGDPASLRTEVRIGYDQAALYVGVRAFDDQPSLIVPGEAIRDNDLTQSDAVMLIFDTYNDDVNGFVFGTNPAGIEYDGQVIDQGGGSGGRRGSLGRAGGGGGGRQMGGSGDGFNLNWDGTWEVATERDAAGWSAEFRIPFSTLRYRSGGAQDWGLNVLRRVRRVNEESSWAAIPREFDFNRVSVAGTLTALEPPLNRSVQVIPYVLGSSARNYAIGEPDFRQNGEAGGDAKVQVTQGLTLDLTYNTDFAQVEVDDVQTNLTRFSIQFPEKRPFFLENSGMFSVGGGGASLFFSRRIGIARDGNRVPIQGGGRLSGKVGGLNVGLLHIRTDELEGVQGEQSYSVVRLARELGNRTSIGGAFLQRDGGLLPDDYNRTYAVDGQLGIGTAWNFNMTAARTDTPRREGRDHMLSAGANYGSRSLSVRADVREIGEDFNPEVGFLRRAGLRSLSTRTMTFIRPTDWFGLREVRPHVNYDTTRDLETGFEESAQVHLDVHFEWNSGMFFSPAFNWVREGLEVPFEISDGVVVAPGTYDGWEMRWHFYTDPSAPVSFETLFQNGSFLSGDRRGHSVVLSLRHGSALSTAFRFEYNDVDLLQGDFVTRLAGLRLGYFFTPEIYLQSLVQYSDQADNWSMNMRFGWLSSAGTGLFVVYNQANGVDTLNGPLNKALILKFSRQFTVLGG